VGGISDNDLNYINSVSAGGSNVIVSGFFRHDATFGGTTLSDTDSSIGTDAFFAGLDASGNFIWAKKLGTKSQAYGAGLDSAGHVYVCGGFNNSADIITNTGTTQLTCDNGSSEVFALSMDAAGNYLWAKQPVGSGNDVATALGVDTTGNIFLAGVCGPAAFDSLPALTGNGDFIAKLGTGGTTSSSPYATWQSAHFTATELATPSISGDTMDPDHDGIPNLMEYALNLDPRKAGTAGLPVRGIAPVSGSNYLKLTFVPNPAATDVTYVVQGAGTLSGSNNWSTVGSGSISGGVWVPTGNFTVTSGTAVAWDTVPITSGTRRFIRLKVIK
jgi:hypothetical protein